MVDVFWYIMMILIHGSPHQVHTIHDLSESIPLVSPHGNSPIVSPMAKAAPTQVHLDGSPRSFRRPGLAPTCQRGGPMGRWAGHSQCHFDPQLGIDPCLVGFWDGLWDGWSELGISTTGAFPMFENIKGLFGEHVLGYAIPSHQPGSTRRGST